MSKTEYIDHAMMWWIWVLTKRAEKHFGSITVGSACDNITMQKFVSVMVRGKGVYLSTRAARTIAKHLSDWADVVDAYNAEAAKNTHEGPHHD